MLRVLTIVGHYLPGFRAGGPIRSVANLVDLMGDELEFRVLTLDRDLGDSAPYAGIRHGRWVPVGKAKVRYLAPPETRPFRFLRVTRDIDFDVVYLNSFFSRMTVWYLVWRRLGLLPRRRTVLAPRGEFLAGAMSIKPAKKQAYLALGRIAGLWDGVHWQASSRYEADHIRRIVHRDAVIAPGVSVPPDADCVVPEQAGRPGRSLSKHAGALTAVYLSRICTQKNLGLALEVLAQIQGDIDFDIYGPLEDQAYWKRCQELIAALPGSVRVEYHGPIVPQRVPDVLAAHHVLILPTRGENYGHVIREALSEGCLPIISDKTPWRGLADHHAGWDVPLDGPDALRAAIEKALAMDQLAYDIWSTCARAFVNDYLQEQGVTQSANYRALFGAE